MIRTGASDDDQTNLQATTGEIGSDIANDYLLDVRHLSVDFMTRHGAVTALNDVSLKLRTGGAMGLVGESGSGKSSLSLAVMRLLASNGRVTSGQIQFAGKDLLTLDPETMRHVRGKGIAMVFQDSFSSLTPTRTVGQHLVETILAHEAISHRQAVRRSKDYLERVGTPSNRFDDYPHQFSGGMRQRVCIAAALVCSPRLLLLDEPTTALDVTLQASILALLRDLRRDFDLTMLFISHDLGVVAEVCDEITVMYAGRVVELGRLQQVASRPSHGYTRGLLASLPRTGRAHVHPLSYIPGTLPAPGQAIPGCIFENRCAYAAPNQGCLDPQSLQIVEPGHRAACIRRDFVSVTPWSIVGPAVVRSARPKIGDPILRVNQITKTFGGMHHSLPLVERWLPSRRGAVRAVDNVSFNVNKGETLGIVGESGSGKTTLARIIVGLLRPTSGSIEYRGRDLTGLQGSDRKAYHRAVQIIFQNPDSTLNPRRKVGDVLARGAELAGIHNNRQQQERVSELLNMVHLPASHASRYPHELSGGEKQRIGLARALALGPEIIVCDEPVSALDVSVTAAVLNLLVELQARLGVTYIFITHDLSVVQHLADRVAVMHAGAICALGETADVFRPPQHPYTERLLSAVPSRLYGFIRQV